MKFTNPQSKIILFAVRLGMALCKLLIGLILGLGLSEVILQLNPKLLWSGMGLPAPATASLISQDYAVHYSDADVFYWHANLIRPISPSANKLEAQVHFETDEFGFPNTAPLPQIADVVILGRSYSMGAQAQSPWPRLLAQQADLSVVNLSQPGNGIVIKKQHWQRFGLPRQPRWVIVEVLPSLDFMGTGYQSHSPILLEGLPFSITQRFLRQFVAPNAAPVSFADQALRPYPLHVDIPGSTVDLVFYSRYLTGLTADQEMLAHSLDWASYKQQLLNLVQDARRQSACVLLLYVPTKENVYFSIATRPEQLEPTTRGLKSWQLSADGYLIETQTSLSVTDMQENVFAARTLVAKFAQGHDLAWADPTEAMADLARAGNDPFMAYDSHWSMWGHQAVAQTVATILQNTTCH